ncbi:tetratricopeptide repeat protein [Streptomyces anandii]|uniref:tetratricopeptide repeat protein n=1 Tax=Streptomyces anandii TaxID=285454 RepID=UPI0037034AB2
MSRLSREKKREDQRAGQSAASAAAPIAVHVPLDGAAASVGGVPVRSAPGEEIQHAVLDHLHRIALATGHPVLATVTDERIGYVVPLQVRHDGSSTFTAEPLPAPARASAPAPPSVPASGSVPAAGSAPAPVSAPAAPVPASGSSVPAPVSAPAPAAGSVPARASAPAPAPAAGSHAARASAPAPAPAPGLAPAPAPASGCAPAPAPVPGLAPAPAPGPVSPPPAPASAPPPPRASATGSPAVPPLVSDVLPAEPRRDKATHVLRQVPEPVRDPAPTFPLRAVTEPGVPTPPTFPLRALPVPSDATPLGTATAPTGEFGPPPVMDAAPVAERKPAPAPAFAPDLARIPDPDPKPTPARGFDAVAEAVLGDDPRTVAGEGGAVLFAEPLARANEAVKAGRIEEAAALAERTVTEASGTLGAEHPEVLRLRELTAYIAYLAGDALRAFTLSLELARIHRRAQDAEGAYGNVQSAASAWRAVRDPEQGLRLGRDLLDLWTELTAEDGPAADDIEQLESARARMGRLAERARKQASPPAG